MPDPRPETEAATLASLTAELREFAAQRDWGQFHTPKNLAMALLVEAAEVGEHFQWLSSEQSDDLDQGKREAVATELADVLLYLILLADRLGVDLLDAAQAKLVENGKKYPVSLSRGSAKKYTEL